ncbi:hypothetical protein [Streptomyces sp. NPDC015131]|uniref:hypothetical protein n=1 Tax=Streptomyces sp. NPDC015131 TaxID=3364941 RepID=UPI003700C26B
METTGARAPAVHGWQRALAWSAAVATVPPLALLLDSYVYPLHVVLAALVAIPLFLTRRPAAFTRATLTVGLPLLPVGLLGLYAGLLAFWPAAVLLLLAAFADPRSRPRSAAVMLVSGALVLAAFLACSGSYAWEFHVRPALAGPRAFRAVTEPDAFYAGLGTHETRLRRLGATTVSEVASGDAHYLVVGFPEDFPEERRAALRAEIATLPGVGRVELCPARECG